PRTGPADAAVCSGSGHGQGPFQRTTGPRAPSAAEVPDPAGRSPQLSRGSSSASSAARERRHCAYRPLAKLTSTIRPTTISTVVKGIGIRSEEHTSELQSRFDLVCRLLLEKKK